MNPLPRLPYQIHLALLFLYSPVLGAAEEQVIASFDSADFGGWETTGTAFGKGPAAGSVDGQMIVSGFQGAGFANSYHGGDDAMGTLTSPEFKITGKYLNFLIGGGGHAGETCLNLLVDSKVVRTATGPNLRPGGNERLDPFTWDLAELSGKSARLEAVDKRTGGWGHITVDHIVQSDRPEVLDISTTFTVDKRYLIWPVAANSNEKHRFLMTLDGAAAPFCFSDISLSAKPDFWTFTDLANHQGTRLTVKARLPRRLATAWEMVKVSDTYPGEQELYQEVLRPRYHFTSRRGWLNDPNGLVRQDGKWHLFYQHNPYNHGWDNMHWGHATSPDLFHWTEHPDALFPDAEGYMYSGSGFVVPKGGAAFPVPGKTALALAYTAEGTRSYLPGVKTTQGLAISTDGGKTFAKFPGNPVLPHIAGENRDPKVFWHEPSRHWVMALYLDGPDYAIFNSPDLVKWVRTNTYQIPGDSECPDLFPLPVPGTPGETRWVAWGAKGRYLIGKFDGAIFNPEGGVKQHYFGNAYAGQSYDNAPDGRRVHIGWMREGNMDKSPFNLQMTLPMEFSLRRDETGLRLHAEPSPEITTLRGGTHEWKGLEWRDGAENPLAGIKEGHFEIEAVVDANTTAREIGFRFFGGNEAVWKPADRSFSGMEGPQAPVDGKIHLRIFVDTVSLEVFVNGSYHARYIRQKAEKTAIEPVANGGSVHFDSLKVHSLRSVWK